MKVNFRKLQKTLFIAFVFFWPTPPPIPYSSFFLHFFFFFSLPLKSRAKSFFFFSSRVFLLHFCTRKGGGKVERIEIACEVYFQGANKWVENKRWQCCWWFSCRENSLKDASVQEKMASFQQVYRSPRTIVLGVLILSVQHFIADESVCKVGFYYHSIEHRSENKRCCDQNILKRFRLFLFSNVCLNFQT